MVERSLAYYGSDIDGRLVGLANLGQVPEAVAVRKSGIQYA
jgi:hypothetical protein